jgi:hypothetical protein
VGFIVFIAVTEIEIIIAGWPAAVVLAGVKHKIASRISRAQDFYSAPVQVDTEIPSF